MLRPRHPAGSAALAFALLSFYSSIAAQNAQIRSRVELVLVPVTVKGPKGAPATGLTKEAFSVKEAGKTQTLTTFSIDPVPISAAILIDTGVSETVFTRVKSSFPALIGAFADDDEIALYRFEKSVERLTEFTPDYARVSIAMGKIERSPVAPSASASGPFSNPGPVINGVPVIPGVSSAGRSAAPPTKVLHDAVFQAAEDLAARNIERRRIVIVISDGQNHNSLHSSDAALERLLTHEVQVFSIGVDLTAFQRLRSPLGSYAKDTGGEAWFPDSQASLESCYSLSTDSARNQYVLGYASSNKRPTAKPVFREIKVQVSLKGGEIRHRRGYYQAP
jgi:Ca-activated chloride channel homolog